MGERPLKMWRSGWRNTESRNAAKSTKVKKSTRVKRGNCISPHQKYFFLFIVTFWLLKYNSIDRHLWLWVSESLGLGWHRSLWACTSARSLTLCNSGEEEGSGDAELSCLLLFQVVPPKSQLRPDRPCGHRSSFSISAPAEALYAIVITRTKSNRWLRFSLGPTSVAQCGDLSSFGFCG